MRPTFSAVVAICIGALMALMWSFFIVTGKVPEFQSRPVEIVLHLVAEYATAILLVVSGALSIRGVRWAHLTMPIAFGMLSYTLVVSPGYYLQQGSYAVGLMFAALLATAIVALILQLRTLMRPHNP